MLYIILINRFDNDENWKINKIMFISLFEIMVKRTLIETRTTTTQTQIYKRRKKKIEKKFIHLSKLESEIVRRCKKKQKPKDKKYRKTAQHKKVL